nr:MAG TPA: hypothetical protein [Caudoviricetes sp.]
MHPAQATKNDTFLIDLNFILAFRRCRGMVKIWA